jgi:hypothetical protein
MSTRQMSQTAPYPWGLERLVSSLRYRQHLGWRVELADDFIRDHATRHIGESKGLTLIVTRCGPNTYDHGEIMRVRHFFAVPPATYNEQSWTMWLFERLCSVDKHEAMEDFAFKAAEDAGTRDGLIRPYAPCHGPGWDPYLITVERTAADRRTAFTGELNEQ